jgi:hypothetical protein
MSRAAMPPEHMFCSFCSKSQHEVKRLIEGGCRNTVLSQCAFICDACVLQVRGTQARGRLLRGPRAASHGHQGRLMNQSKGIWQAMIPAAAGGQTRAALA